MSHTTRLLLRVLFLSLIVCGIGIHAAANYEGASVTTAASSQIMTLTPPSSSDVEAAQVHMPPTPTYGYLDRLPSPKVLAEMSQQQTNQAAALSAVMVMGFVLITSVRFKWPFLVQ
jgi:hypothetical protein